LSATALAQAVRAKLAATSGPIGGRAEWVDAEDDEAFLTSAYRALLGRRPDPEGLQSHLARLHAGSSRIEALAALASSPEGRNDPALGTWAWVPAVLGLLGVTNALPDIVFLQAAYRMMAAQPPGPDAIVERCSALARGEQQRDIFNGLLGEPRAAAMVAADRPPLTRLIRWWRVRELHRRVEQAAQTELVLYTVRTETARIEARLTAHMDRGLREMRGRLVELHAGEASGG
jgi:hypothetical protein